MSTEENLPTQQAGRSLQHVDQMYQTWFLDYASYVILDRAIPELDDGLKPVQRRLLHAMSEVEDGRYNKAANIIGNTMRYHPHGDMAIGDALVKLAQKNLLIDTQGNWGNPVTGDRAAASRYIEARLTPFAKEVVFNPNITPTQLSYDGRSKEPLCLPTKFPLLLFQGAEGIAVGLSTKILPHNFCELIKESIAILKGYKPKLYPDFAGGGLADFSSYMDGKKGGKIKVRAHIEVASSKLLKIKEIPFGTTTSSLIDSIIAAGEKNKIKIRKIEDNTAKDVDILVHLPSSGGASPEQTLAALYAFTDCELSLSPSCCVIAEGKPVFCSVSDLLTRSTYRTKHLLKQELEYEQRSLQEKLHMALLEKVFIEQKIYRQIEKYENWDDVVGVVLSGLTPFKTKFLRAISKDDIHKLLETRIRRISKFDANKANELIAALQKRLKEIEQALANLTDYCIAYFKALLKKYGKLYPRKTKLSSFETIRAEKLVVADKKVFVNYKEGFVGSSLKQDELLGECSQLSEIITLNDSGSLMIHRVADKTFVGKNIIFAKVFQKNERCAYHLIYRDGREGAVMAKRFNLSSYTRGKSYDLTKGNKSSKVLYFSEHPNAESEKVQLLFKSTPLIKKKTVLDFDFGQLPVKSRQIVGTQLTKAKVDKVVQTVVGASTLAAERVWFDRQSKRLNTEGKGGYVGKFKGEESLVAVYQTGRVEILPFDRDYPFAADLIDLAQQQEELVLTVVYYDEQKDDSFVKRVAVGTLKLGSHDYLSQKSGIKVLLATLCEHPCIEASFTTKQRNIRSNERIDLTQLIDVKGIQALGNRLSRKKLERLRLVAAD